MVDSSFGHNVFLELSRFMAEREWEQFHSEENLAKSIAIEAAELLECFQWKSNGDRREVSAELADVLTYCYLLSQKLEMDPHELILHKLEITREKYPVDKSRASSTKYDKL